MRPSFRTAFILLGVGVLVLTSAVDRALAQTQPAPIAPASINGAPQPTPNPDAAADKLESSAAEKSEPAFLDKSAGRTKLIRPNKSAGPPNAVKPPAPMDKVTVRFTYISKVLVPRGSDLRVTFAGQPGAAPQIFKTKNDAPPYTIALRLPLSITYPVRASAMLKSPIGHQFGADFEIKQEDKNGVPILVTMDGK